MEERLKKYVEKIFEEAPKNKKAYDLKEEIIANLIDKYNDLKSSGKQDEESYNIAISNLGDIEELVNNLKDSSNVLNNKDNEKQRNKSALLISIAVGLYIFSVIPVILFSELPNNFDNNYLETVGIMLMFMMVGIATMILVYNGVSRSKYKKIDDTMVEEFKEWKAEKDANYEKTKSIKGAMWAIIVAIYLYISFAFMSWHYSWIIFIIGSAIDNIIDAVFTTKS